jgi:hypothetical protein
LAAWSSLRSWQCPRYGDPVVDRDRRARPGRITAGTVVPPLDKPDSCGELHSDQRPAELASEPLISDMTLNPNDASAPLHLRWHRARIDGVDADHR